MSRDPSEVRRLWIPGEVGRLEAVLRIACPARGVALVAHPHPLHGGTLHNPVVFHAERALHGLGLTTMRFNFRGVGESEGRHDEGRGEVADVAAAASWLRGLAPRAPLLLAGYSFGAVCSLRHAVADRTARAVIAIGLPVRHQPLGQLIAGLDKPLAVIQGSRDELGSPDEVRDLLAAAPSPASVHTVDGASHLFPGQARAAADSVRRAAAQWLETA